MFSKFKDKKGLTLIEMMAVIAIIAVLVSIVTPSIVKYTTKANAATNAANLRAVKATISTMMTEGKITYSSAGDTQSQIDDIVAQQSKLNKNDLFQFLEWEKLETKRVILRGAIIANDRYNNTYYGHDGAIDIDGVVLSAPVSKAIRVDGLNLRAGTEMKATVCGNEIVMTYGGITLDVFALIAEHGDGSKIDMSKTEHSYIDSNNDGKCDLCDDKYVHGRGEEAGAEIDKELGNMHSCADKSGDGDHVCDDRTCGLTCTDCDTKGEKASCSECGTPHICDHSEWNWGKYNCKGCGSAKKNCPNCG